MVVISRFVTVFLIMYQNAHVDTSCCFITLSLILTNSLQVAHMYTLEMQGAIIVFNQYVTP